MFKEFKKFAFKGNVIDLAVGVIIGGAFGKITTSLVNDIIMPLLGIIIGGINFKDLKIIITPAEGDIAESAIRYGAFIQSVTDFLIISISIFLFVKLLSKAKKKTPPPPPPPPPAPSKEEVLLTEIRDILKANQENT
ncbi:MAG: large-conductance mechanosensitive channel protein MscL [Eubacteriales bacterium]|jgi:large conductance mechanosensitive channel|nr:large-conductance mechanosensitive channel protein MscL [Eubacteriales bacterium]